METCVLAVSPRVPLFFPPGFDSKFEDRQALRSTPHPFPIRPEHPRSRPWDCSLFDRTDRRSAPRGSSDSFLDVRPSHEEAVIPFSGSSAGDVNPPATPRSRSIARRGCLVCALTIPRRRRSRFGASDRLPRPRRSWTQSSFVDHNSRSLRGSAHVHVFRFVFRIVRGRAMVEKNPWYTRVEGPFPSWQGPVGVKEDGGGCTRGRGRVSDMRMHRAVNNRDKDGA